MSEFKNPVLREQLKKARIVLYKKSQSKKKTKHAKKLQKLLGRNSRKYIWWRKFVFKKFNFKCVLCGSKKRLHAHHRKEWQKFPTERFNVENGILLCFDCHAGVHPWMNYEKRQEKLDEECRQIGS